MLINYFLGCTESTKSMFFLKEGGLQATRSQRVKHNCSDLAHTHITFVFQICFHNICFPDYQNYKTKVYKVIKITFPKSLANNSQTIKCRNPEKESVYNINMLE